MKLLSRIALGIDPWGTPVGTGFQMDLEQVFSLSHCLLIHPLLCEDLSGDCIKNLAEDHVANIHHTHVIYQVSYFITESGADRLHF